LSDLISESQDYLILNFGARNPHLFETAYSIQFCLALKRITCDQSYKNCENIEDNFIELLINSRVSERTKYLKILNTDVKIILLHYQIRMLKLVARMSKFFALLIMLECPIIILIIQQNYFQIYM